MASLYQRGSVWYCKFQVSGEVIRKPLGRDKRQAQLKMADMIKDYEAGKGGYANHDMSYEAFEEKFLAHRKPIMKYGTYSTDRRALRLLRENLPVTKLSSVTPDILDRLVGILKEQGLGAVNLNRTIRAIKYAMGKAESWGLRTPMVWKGIKGIKEPPCKLLFYTKEELNDLLKFCHGRWMTVALLGSLTGLRRSEMHWLAWEDVDFIRARVHIVGKKDCKPRDDWEPKDYEQRWIPMPPQLSQYLSGLPKDSYWVLGDDCPAINYMTTLFRRISKKANLKGNIHTLRHTYASHLVQAGVSLYIVQKRLGHESPETTQKYAHLAPDVDRSGLDKLPQLDLGMASTIPYNANSL